MLTIKKEELTVGDTVQYNTQCPLCGIQLLLGKIEITSIVGGKNKRVVLDLCATEKVHVCSIPKVGGMN